MCAVDGCHSKWISFTGKPDKGLTSGNGDMLLEKDTENTLDGIDKDVWRKMKTKRTILLRIRQCQLKFRGHINRKEGLENLTHTY